MTTLTIDEIIDKDEVLKMARQVEFNVGFKWCVNFIELEAFAKLVAEKSASVEREACAKVCEPQEAHDDPLTAWKIAQAIRARGNT
jgi:hypothetical protein